MSDSPKRKQVTRPVAVWLEAAARLAARGDGDLAAALRYAMDRRPVEEQGAFALSADEQRRVDAALQDGRGERDAD